MKFQIIIFVSFLIYGCQNVDINDKDKRNENWMYWVDSSTGEASWIHVSDQTTVKNGRFTSFFKNGRIYQKGKFKNGECVDTIYCYDINENLQKYMLVKPDTLLHYYIKEGSYVAYFQSGKILEKGIIKNHKRGDRWTRYFENGQIEFIQDFKDGNGLTRWYYDNGQISDSAYTIKGENHGQIKFWFKNGQIKEISNWNNGLQNGVYELYYENGKLKEHTYWTNGKPEKCESWYDNGQKKIIKFHLNGLLDGNAMQWYPNGNLQKKMSFSLGQMNGQVIEYYENGKIKSEGIYKNEQKDGIFIFYDEKGRTTKKTYIDGKIQTIK